LDWKIFHEQNLGKTKFLCPKFVLEREKTEKGEMRDKADALFRRFALRASLLDASHIKVHISFLI
jgi:hypothetical protein